MILFMFAVAGSALILTQSVIFAPAREWLRAASEAHERASELATMAGDGTSSLKHRVIFARLATVSKLVSCPMCAGFWLGLAWSAALDAPVPWTLRTIATFLAHGAAGSIASAIGVALWILLVEAHDVGALWRYRNRPEE